MINILKFFYSHNHNHDHINNDNNYWLSIINRNIEIILSSITGLLWVTGLIVHYFDYVKIANVLFVIAYFSGGIFAFKESIHGILSRRFNIESLMVFAAIGAGFLGKLSDGALLLFLFSLGHSLEHFVLDKAKFAIKNLTNITPKKALVKLASGQTSEVLVSNLVLHQIVRVSSGQIIPCDGVVIAGVSSVDQSTITGESVPVFKTINDKVYAGTMNSNGTLEISVTKLAQDTVLSKIMYLITQTDAKKSKIQKFTEKFEQIFVPIVIIFVLLIAILPPLVGLINFKQSIYLSIVVLVSASPCALALATPVAILAGISRATRGGILIKGGLALENLSQVKAIAFDKTGTLTEGKPTVSNVIMLDNYDRGEMMSVVYGLELGSSHPLAVSIIEYCKANNITPKNVLNIHNIVGHGLVGEYRNIITDKTIKVCLGNRQMFIKDVGLKLDAIIEAKITQLENLGFTTVLVVIDSVIFGLITISDQIRESTSQTMLEIKKLGIVENIMLTGDNQVVANKIGALAGIDKIYANLMPEDKSKKIEEIMKDYGVVAMVGDGVNDALAMAKASVGIAMGGSKMDVALETADIVLMDDKIHKLVLALRISMETKKIMKQNILISLGVLTILVGFALSSMANIGLVVFIHEGSSLFVIFNALRIFKIK